MRAGTPVLALAEAFRASFSPRTESEAVFVDSQLQQAESNARATWYLLPTGVAFITAVNVPWLPLWRLITWPGLIMAAALASGLYYNRLLARRDSSVAGIAHRAKAYAVGSLAQTIALCSIGLLFWAPSAPANHSFIAILLCAVLAAWTSVGTLHFATGVLSLPVFLIILMLGPITSGNPMAMGTSATYWLIMAFLFRTNYTTRERMMRLEVERGALIDNLTLAKSESDAARVRAETASRAKSAFLANMSHELRTPLNAILGFSEIIQTKAMGTVDQYAEYGGYIHGSGEHLLSLINDILDLAKIESGRLTLREADLDLRHLMDETAKLMTPKAITAGIALAVHVDRSFPNVHADERALRQILVNLASNAIKFTPPGGRVTAFANVMSDGALAFGLDDTGIGIAPEDHARVFESFGQGRHDAVLGDKGTGLGLPIVKGLAEAHGGSVILNSVRSEGTRITVILPPHRGRARLRAVG
jgi:two-component system cell cycle sensor histidine kinase PleC